MWFRGLLVVLLAGVIWGQKQHLVLETGGRLDAARLRAQGVELLEPLGKGQWIVSASPETDGSKLGRPIPVEKKLSEELREGRVPSWAQVKLRGGEGIELLIYFHKDVNADEAQWELDRVGAVLVDRSDYFERLTAKIRAEDLRMVAGMDWVRYVEPVFPPFQLESNADSAMQIRVDQLRRDYGMNGAGARVAIIDDPVDAHPEFGERLKQMRPGQGVLHGTHVAGTVAAAGVTDERLRGMAPEAKLVSFGFGSIAEGIAANLNAKLFEEADLGQNSWGGVVRESLNNCNLHGSYTSFDREFDRLVYQEKFPIVFSTGNDRNKEDCLVPARAGYYTLPPPKSAKNLIAVGAVDLGQAISTFSSAGPTRDGRLKPDLVALGVSILSTGVRGGTSTLSGTSMAAPAVSGLSALLIDRFRERYGRAPSPELLKALLLNTAKDLGNPGPDYQYGYGIADGVAAVAVLDEEKWRTERVGMEETREIEIDVPGGAPSLRVMLAWTDPPAPAGRIEQLMNDLDLKLINPEGQEVLPFRLDPRRPERDAARGENRLDNVEQVAVDAPLGGRWKIVVKARELVVGPQDFAVTWTTAENPRPLCTTTVTPSSFSVPERAGPVTVQIARSSTCEGWTAESLPEWITAGEPSNPVGSGTVKLAVAANDSGEQRVASFQIAGQNVQLRQNTACQVQEVKPGVEINASLMASDCLQEGFAQPFYAKVYGFEARAGQRVVIRVNSRTTDPYIYFHGPGGIYLAEDDDSGGGLNSRIPASGSLVLPLDGKYQIVVSTAFSGQTGTFSLQLDLEDGAGDTSGLPRILPGCPVEVEGELTERSSREGRRGDLYRTNVYLFQGRVGQKVRLGLLEAEFDGVAYLLAPTGATLAFEDDTNGKLPVIESVLTANGVYRLEISSYAPFGTGRYKLAGEGCSGWDGR